MWVFFFFKWGWVQYLIKLGLGSIFNFKKIGEGFIFFKGRRGHLSLMPTATAKDKQPTDSPIFTVGWLQKNLHEKGTDKQIDRQTDRLSDY